MEKFRSFSKDRLNVRVYSSEELAGNAAAHYVADRINRVISEKGNATIILATGTSQFTFLESLKNMAVDWKRITVFHLDEYRDIPETHPASFRRYLKERILDIVKPGEVHLIQGDSPDPESFIRSYENLLRKNPADVACIGIGENGHIAFNDPPVADFNDPHLVKIVDLDDACRRQQLGEGWFPSLEAVPGKAITLTIPAIMNSRMISCLVPGARKSEAVRNTLVPDISTSCPASILRQHQDALLFLDREAASGLDING